MKLFATMCNQAQRLLEALGQARSALVAKPPVARWGLGYVQSGELLLARTPRPSTTPVDLFAALDGVKSDCVIGHAVDGRASATATTRGTDDTPPYRYRRWMYVQDGPPTCGAAWEPLAAQVPDYLRRNIKGKGTAELTFHVLLAKLHDDSAIDDVNLPMPVLRRAVADATRMVSLELTKAGISEAIGNLAVSNGRCMLVARIASPLWLRRLHIAAERGGRDETFRGVLLVSGDFAGSDGFEEIPASSAVTVTRDLRVDVHPLYA
jgi:predicted glutamine amidotransferase